MAKKRVSDLLVDTLVSWGVERIYGVCGDSLNGVTDAIRATDGIEWAHVRHEEAAAFAAGAEAHLTDRLAVCAGSCGPGNLHLINGLYDCHRSRVPVLAIAAQIPSGEIGSEYFQETDPAHLFAQCSHYCGSVSHPDDLPRILETAAQIALSKRGVAVIVLPGDVALQHTDSGIPRLPGPDAPALVCPTDDDVTLLASLLNGAKKVTILGGAGCANAHTELVQLAAKLKAPVVHAFRGKEYIEYDNPCDVGMTGLIGFSSGYHAMMGCDLLVMLGTDFPYRQFYPKGAKIVQVDIRGENLGRRTRLDHGFVGDVKTTLKALLPKIDGERDDGFLKTALEHYRKTRKSLDELATGEAGHTPMHPQFVAKTLNDLAADDAIFTCDVGTPSIWAARYLTMNGKRRLLGSFVHGSMANAMPQAIGAQACCPDRQVIALCGDGGFAMLMGEIATMRQIGLPVKLVVFRNDSLGFVELEMKAAGFLDFATDLNNPDFAMIANASGVLGISVTQPEDLAPAISRALAHPGPALVEAYVNRQEIALPPSIKAQQALGFGLFLIKAVLSGRGDEVVDLAKTNLFR